MDTADTTNPISPLDRRCRLARPERIELNHDVLVRNDVLAAERGVSTKTLNRADALGAPYTFVGGVKYRPLKAYRDYETSRIRQAKPPRTARRRT